MSCAPSGRRHGKPNKPNDLCPCRFDFSILIGGAKLAALLHCIGDRFPQHRLIAVGHRLVHGAHSIRDRYSASMMQNQVTGKAPVAVPVPTEATGLTEVERLHTRMI